MAAYSTNTQTLLSAALRDPNDRGPLLQHCANYLRLLAATHADRRIQSRVGESDVVQESLLEAHRDFTQFRGRNSAEFLAWLRQILVHNMSRMLDCHLGTGKRDVRREQSVLAASDRAFGSAVELVQILTDQGTSPSLQAVRHEELLALSEALHRLSPDHNAVMVYRHLEGLSFREVAERMNRSEGAVRVLWFRAMEQLRRLLSEKGVL